MEATRNLCAQVPVSLHDQVRREREALGQSLSEYITRILHEHFEGGKTTMAATMLGGIMAKLYVAYGSNLNMGQMHDRCPTAEFVGTGVAVREIHLQLLEHGSQLMYTYVI